MGNPVVYFDDVRAVRLDGMVSRVRFRVVGLNDSDLAILFSDMRSGRDASLIDGEPSRAIATLLEEVWLQLDGLSTGMSLRWFEHVSGRSVTGDTCQEIVEVFFHGDSKPQVETASMDAGTPEARGKIRTADQWLAARRKPFTFKAAEKLLGFPPSGVPFLVDQVVCPSGIGEGTGLDARLTTKILRRLEPSEVIVEIGGKERTCPAMWFRLYFPRVSSKKTGAKGTKSAAPVKVKPEPVQKFEVGEVVGFDAYDSGLGAHPKGTIIRAVSPDEDPLSILEDLMPEWKQTHTLLSPPARLSASANVFRYWIVAEPTERSARGRQPRPRLLLKREDWLGRAD